jgi:hypothetical protein
VTEDRHARYRARLVDLAHGELNPWDAFLLRSHLRHCPTCRREWSEIGTLWGSLRRLSADVPALSTRPRLKGKAMQTRLALAASAAVAGIVGASVAARALFPHRYAPATVARKQDAETRESRGEFETSRMVESLGQFWFAYGTGRGKLLIYDRDGKEVSSLTLWGRKGSAFGATVEVRAESKPLGKFRVAMGTRYAYRDANRRFLYSCAVVPLTAREIADLEAEDRADAKRYADLYRNPACITLDTAGKSGGGYEELPGLIAWSLEVMRDETGTLMMTPDDKARPLDNGGLAWKLYGDARVTMTLLTDAEPYVRTYRTRPRKADTPVSEGVPKIYWYQAVSPGDAPPPPNVSAIYGVGRNCWITADGTFYETRQAGQFTGYGKHTVRDENGKILMTLDVSPP